MPRTFTDQLFGKRANLFAYEPGDHFIRCNFAQDTPHTLLNCGDATFEFCDLTNCDLPPTATNICSLNIHWQWGIVQTLTPAQYAEVEAAVAVAHSNKRKGKIPNNTKFEDAETYIQEQLKATRKAAIKAHCASKGYHDLTENLKHTINKETGHHEYRRVERVS